MKRKPRWISLILALLLISLLAGCGSSNTDSGVSGMKSVEEYSAENPDFNDSESFENALNSKEDVVGKTVRFCVVKYEPKSSLGINCWAGEHLNFVSDNELDVKEGYYVTGVVTKKPSKVLGSWKIPYAVIEIDDGKSKTAEESKTNSEVTTSESIENETAEILATETEEVVSKEHYNRSLKGHGWADVGRREPQYVDVIGWIGLSADDEFDLRKSDEFNKTPWMVSTYVQDKQFWNKADKVEVKTEVIVRDQILEHEGYGSYSGYLLVERTDNQEQFYIDVGNFYTKDYWTSSDIYKIAQEGYCVAEFNQVSDYYPVSGNRHDSKADIADGKIVLVMAKENADRPMVKAMVFQQWRNGYGGVECYFDPADLSFIY